MLPSTADLLEMPKQRRNEILIGALQEGQFDFLDFGSHTGRGLKRGVQLGGTRGLGIEIDDDKSLALMREGFYVYSDDLLNLPSIKRTIKFALCSHILEHLPGKYHAGIVLNRLATLASEFILIEQPNFSNEMDLFRKGLVAAHSTLTYHTWFATARDFVEVITDLGLYNWIMCGAIPMESSEHNWIHAAGAPPNSWFWEDGKSDPKKKVAFPRTQYRDIVIVVGTDLKFDVEPISKKAGVDRTFMRSYWPPGF